MKLLYGTANPGKLQHMREMLEGLDIEIIGLNDFDLHIDQIDESGNNPLANAKIKAFAYYKAAKIPVFSCDTGLYIEGLDDEKQPGVHVRRVNGKALNDEEMIEYYTSLALNFGGNVRAKYKNAICLILDEENIFEYDGDDISSVSFLISSKPHQKRTAGFPLDSISVEIETRKYFIDLDSNSNFQSELAEGFRNFFLRTILK
ncbi:MAG: non-canonical purine NTP pyrophosphatase [Halanaerobiales bacterium]|nr:non-canonical purine NTP pyrophosphatase [Halanaerobiales bacterium]